MGFFGRLSSGIAYGLGIGIGLAIWNLIRKTLMLAVIGGGLALALRGSDFSLIGIDGVQVAGWLRNLQVWVGWR